MRVALQAASIKQMEKMGTGFATSYAPKNQAPGENLSERILTRVRVERKDFNKPLEVRRRLTRIIMSYCMSLREAMRSRGPQELMQIIRDAMIVYYEAYKLPESGFIQGGKHFINIFMYKC